MNDLLCSECQGSGWMKHQQKDSMQKTHLVPCICAAGAKKERTFDSLITALEDVLIQTMLRKTDQRGSRIMEKLGSKTSEQHGSSSNKALRQVVDRYNLLQSGVE